VNGFFLGSRPLHHVLRTILIIITLVNRDGYIKVFLILLFWDIWKNFAPLHDLRALFEIQSAHLTQPWHIHTTITLSIVVECYRSRVKLTRCLKKSDYQIVSYLVWINSLVILIGMIAFLLMMESCCSISRANTLAVIIIYVFLVIIAVSRDEWAFVSLGHQQILQLKFHLILIENCRSAFHWQLL